MPRILIVDDRPNVRLSLCYMLEACGFEVFEAGDGSEALARLAQESIDVVLTDIFMPGLDGIGLIKVLRKDPRPPLIIAMTGLAHLNEGAQHRMAMELADAVLIKPFTREHLVDTIETVGRARAATPRQPR